MDGMNREILKYSLIGAGITTAWILIVVSIIFNAEALFSDRVPEDNLLIPVVMLHVFVISAAVTSMGVFGRPLMWYLDGRKKDAVMLAIYTIVLLVIAGLLILIFLLFS
jgi:hypothetical protein